MPTGNYKVVYFEHQLAYPVYTVIASIKDDEILAVNVSKEYHRHELRCTGVKNEEFEIKG